MIKLKSFEQFLEEKAIKKWRGLTQDELFKVLKKKPELLKQINYTWFNYIGSTEIITKTGTLGDRWRANKAVIINKNGGIEKSEIWSTSIWFLITNGTDYKFSYKPDYFYDEAKIDKFIQTQNELLIKDEELKKLNIKFDKQKQKITDELLKYHSGVIVTREPSSKYIDIKGYFFDKKSSESEIYNNNKSSIDAMNNVLKKYKTSLNFGKISDEFNSNEVYLRYTARIELK